MSESSTVPFPAPPAFGDAAELVSLLMDAPVPEVPVRLEARGRGWDTRVLHEPLPADPRSDSAGLFLWRADPEVHTVAVFAPGVAAPADGTGPERRVAVIVAADRHGEVASALRPEVGDPIVDAEAPGGLLVDGLRRALGLPTTGPVPEESEYALAGWLDGVVEFVLRGRSLRAATVATLRPPEPLDWAEHHRRAVEGAMGVPDLSAAEAAWMDTPMFARWVRGALPTIGELLDTLAALLSPSEQRIVGSVIGDAFANGRWTAGGPGTTPE